MSDTASPLRWYHATAVFSVLFALAGFSYNVWRMEVTEHNSSVREASFELLLQLAELEQLVYAAHYDKNAEEGSPRVGWVKVGLIVDLSMACGHAVSKQSAALRSTWQQNWQLMAEQRDATNAIVAAIDGTRSAVHAAIADLQ